MRTHPYADKYPMLPDDELAELAESIRANGLRQPIVTDREGRILDGRNRYRACELAGVQPDYVVYDGEDLAEYVIDCNTSRRHMSTGARAMATALVLAEDGRRRNGRWTRGSIDITGSGNSSQWRQRLTEAGVVLDYTPHLANNIITGTLALDAAYREANQAKQSAEAAKIAARNQARAQREAEQAEAERQTRLLNELTEAAATQFLAYIDSGEMTIPTAHAAWTEATRKQREEQQQLDHSYRTTMRAIHTALTTFQGGADYATTIYTKVYPHEHRLMDPHEHLTIPLINTAIDYLTRLKEHLQ
ncbi:ParB N-terminal domain-containing protein [Trueperella bialowiezensis]|uniref:ParB/RepB/Spo0J family partition protein n=1 Tax=Trueperella bialowiezensis TaxID=312285 RepID=A0A3S5EW21_9ACTO|nr:ParB/RepB/Spo0J family partition protein [Trueperella bialowiezensis]VEI13250.1 ParB/RepB/Spo0J family partition protein [Trueperella bialowiezensis]